jgi:hypothetical protein
MPKKTAFPLIAFKAGDLFHVGTFDPADKGTGSHEGGGLSVSMHPDAWRGIARLSGGDWAVWREGHAFLDFHALTKAQRKAVLAWAAAEGLVREETRWRTEVWDDEWERTLVTTFATREQAVAELGWEEDAETGNLLDEAGEPLSAAAARALKEVRAWVPTEALCREMRAGGGDHATFALDWAAVAYAERVLGVDGVWWEDEFDEERLSAPRGVIVPSMVAGWKKVPLVDDTLGDACPAEGLPRFTLTAKTRDDLALYGIDHEVVEIGGFEFVVDEEDTLHGVWSWGEATREALAAALDELAARRGGLSLGGDLDARDGAAWAAFGFGEEPSPSP